MDEIGSSVKRVGNQMNEVELNERTITRWWYTQSTHGIAR